MFTKQQETLAENELWELDEARLSSLGSILVESNSAQRSGLEKLATENATVKKDKIRFNDLAEALRIARDIKERFEGPAQGRGVSVNQKKHANHMMRLRSEIINEAYKQSKKSTNLDEQQSTKRVYTDSEGNDVKIGDRIAFAVSGKPGKVLDIAQDSGKIMVKVKWENEGNENWVEASDTSLHERQTKESENFSEPVTKELSESFEEKFKKLKEIVGNSGTVKKMQDRFFISISTKKSMDKIVSKLEKLDFVQSTRSEGTNLFVKVKSTGLNESEAQVLDDLQRFLEDYFGEEVRLWSQGNAAKAQISGLMGDGWDADMIEANAQELHREQAFQQIISGVYEFNGSVHDEDSDILTLYFRIL